MTSRSTRSSTHLTLRVLAVVCVLLVAGVSRAADALGFPEAEEPGTDTGNPRTSGIDDVPANEIAVSEIPEVQRVRDALTVLYAAEDLREGLLAVRESIDAFNALFAAQGDSPAYPVEHHARFVEWLEETERALRAVLESDQTSPRFIRGDVNHDEQVDISDATRVLNWLFLGGGAPGCESAADVNNDEKVDVSDASYTLAFLFLGGPNPPAPNPTCGVDESPGALGCDVPACGSVDIHEAARSIIGRAGLGGLDGGGLMEGETEEEQFERCFWRWVQCINICGPADRGCLVLCMFVAACTAPDQS